MRLLVCGSRNMTDYKTVEKAILDIHFDEGRLDGVYVIIAGEAKGADSLAKQVAHRHGFKYLGFPALWGQHGRSAGPIRNRQMLEEGRPDLVLAFWDGKSPGTGNMVKISKEAGVEVRVVAI